MEPGRRRRPPAAAAPLRALRAAQNAKVAVSEGARPSIARSASTGGLVGFGRCRTRDLDHAVGHKVPALGPVKPLFLGLRPAIGPFALLMRPFGFHFLPFPF